MALGAFLFGTAIFKGSGGRQCAKMWEGYVNFQFARNDGTTHMFC